MGIFCRIYNHRFIHNGRSEKIENTGLKALSFYCLQPHPVVSGNPFGAQGLVYHQGSPCIGCGITFLGIAQYFGIPVRHALRLGNLLAEQNRIYLLQALLADIELVHHFLNLHKTFRGKRGYTVQHQKVVFQRHARLYNIFILEKPPYIVRYACQVYPEKDAAFFGRYLQ